MDLMSSAQLSITDVIVVSHPVIQDAVEASAKRTLSPEQDFMKSTPFNVFCGKSSLVRMRARARAREGMRVHACFYFFPFLTLVNRWG